MQQLQVIKIMYLAVQCNVIQVQHCCNMVDVEYTHCPIKHVFTGLPHDSEHLDEDSACINFSPRGIFS